MSVSRFDEFDSDIEEYSIPEAVIIEVSPSTKLARRRRIEELFEERRLKEELADFA